MDKVAILAKLVHIYLTRRIKVLKMAGWPCRFISVRRCGRLSMVLLRLKDPLELFVKRRESVPGSGFLARRDMTKAVESDIKPLTFLPLFQANGELSLSVTA